MNRRSYWCSMLAAFPALAFAAGCASGTPVVILTHPPWSYEQYASMAVMPFASRVPEVPDAGAQVSRALEQALTDNPATTAHIVPWATITARLEAPERFELPGRVERGEPLPETLRPMAQALITGVCTQYETIGDVQKRWVSQPSYVTNADGDSILMGEHLVERDRYVHAATVAAELRVIDTATGRVLHRHGTGPVTIRREQWRAPPAERPEALAAQAIGIVARRLVREVAVMQARVKVRANALITASRLRKNRWHEQREFSAEAPKLFVVVRALPSALDGAHVRIEVRNKGGRTPIFSEDFEWSSTYEPSGRRFAFVPAKLVETDGVGEFRATLYVTDEAVAERGFRIRARKDD